MVGINLLPQDLKPKGYVVTVAKTLRKVALVALVFFIFGGSILFGVFIFFNQRIRSSESKQEEVKTEIKAQEKTEQRLILLKDRIDKISNVQGISNANSKVSVLDEVHQLFTEGITPKEVNLKDDEALVKVYASSLTNLSNFITQITHSGRFKTINLISFEFSPEFGYSAEFDFGK